MIFLVRNISLNFCPCAYFVHNFACCVRSFPHFCHWNPVFTTHWQGTKWSTVTLIVRHLNFTVFVEGQSCCPFKFSPPAPERDSIVPFGSDWLHETGHRRAVWSINGNNGTNDASVRVADDVRRLADTDPAREQMVLKYIKC